MIEGLIQLKNRTCETAPLVHCLTGQVTTNDCANILLAIGASPIMAEHPDEVREITAGADALYINLAGVTGERLQAMRISSAEAHRRGIPVVLDLVGVGCSGLRLDFAVELLRDAPPGLIKGNVSEIEALARGRTVSRGVDAATPKEQGEAERQTFPKLLSEKYKAVVLASGPVDRVVDQNRGYRCKNGHPILGRLTGTGCMLGALAAAYAAAGDPLRAALLATAVEGIAGELAAAAASGVGSFKPLFFDAVDRMTDECLRSHARIEEMEL